MQLYLTVLPVCSRLGAFLNLVCDRLLPQTTQVDCVGTAIPEDASALKLVLPHLSWKKVSRVPCCTILRRKFLHIDGTASSSVRKTRHPSIVNRSNSRYKHLVLDAIHVHAKVWRQTFGNALATFHITFIFLNKPPIFVVV